VIAVSGIRWVKEKERDSEVLQSSIYLTAYSPKHMAKMGRSALRNYMVCDNRWVYIAADELEEDHRAMAARDARLGSYARLLTNRFLRAARSYEKFLGRMQDHDYTRLRSQVLAVRYQGFLAHLFRIIPYGHLISTVLDPVAEEKILPYLESKNPQLVYRELLRPTRPTLLGKEYQSRIRLAAYRETNGEEAHFRRLAELHTRKFAWLNCYQPTDKPLTVTQLINQIREIEGLQTPPLATRHKLPAKIPVHIRMLAKVMRENAWLRTYRRELMSRGYFVMHPLHAEIARRMEIPVKELSSLAWWEIEDFLVHGKRVPGTEIARRKRHNMVMMLDGKVGVHSAKNVPQFEKAQHTPFSSVLKGIMASPGRAVGPVRIITKREQIPGVRQGDILVMHAAMSWMFPALPRCAALVAEVGGALSHTAVIARELGKPCVIGVAGVMAALHDGEVVVVDADDASVQIISEQHL
jgi:phosphohistidine swiveling domain-containing protein